MRMNWLIVSKQFWSKKEKGKIREIGKKEKEKNGGKIN